MRYRAPGCPATTQSRRLYLVKSPEPNTAPRARVAWIDAARCIAMFFILWMHTGEGPDWLGKPVGGAICLFFILAGYFMPREAGKCARRALKLGMAWLLWSCISFALFLLVRPELQWTWEKVFGWGTSAYNVPLWFLRNLTIYQLIIAALAALRVFPRYNWLVLVLLISFHWAAEPRQHEGLRFDWMQAVLLGYCLRCVPPGTIQRWLQSHAAAIIACIVLMYLQRAWHPDVLEYFDISTYGCSLPMTSLSYAVIYCLAGIYTERFLPRCSPALTMAGACMLFIYAAHSLLYAPIYNYKIHGFYDIWAPIGALVILTTAGTWLMRKCPRIANALCAK